MASSKTNNIKEKITTRDVEKRAHDILKSLVASSDFEFKILLKQLSNWTPAKRRQTFRLIFMKLFTNTQCFQGEYLDPILNERGISWYDVNRDFILIKIVDKFISGIMEMDKNERFVPEKVYTLPKINTDLLLIEPRLLSYILDNNIIAIGTSFSIKGTSFNIIEDRIREYVWHSRSFNKIEATYKAYGLNLDIIFNISKIYLISISRMIDNLKIIFNHTIVKDNKMSDRNTKIYSDICQAYDKIIISGSFPLSKLSNYSKSSWQETLERAEKSYPGCVMPEAELIFINSKLMKKVNLEYQKIEEIVAPMVGEKIEKSGREFQGEAFDPECAII